MMSVTVSSASSGSSGPRPEHVVEQHRRRGRAARRRLRRMRSSRRISPTSSPICAASSPRGSLTAACTSMRSRRTGCTCRFASSTVDCVFDRDGAACADWATGTAEDFSCPRTSLIKNVTTSRLASSSSVIPALEMIAFATSLISPASCPRGMRRARAASNCCWMTGRQIVLACSSAALSSGVRWARSFSRSAFT